MGKEVTQQQLQAVAKQAKADAKSEAKSAADAVQRSLEKVVQDSVTLFKETNAKIDAVQKSLEKVVQDSVTLFKESNSKIDDLSKQLTALKTRVDGIEENSGERFSEAEEIFRKAKANDDRIEAKVDALAAGKD